MSDGKPLAAACSLGAWAADYELMVTHGFGCRCKRSKPDDACPGVSAQVHETTGSRNHAAMDQANLGPTLEPGGPMHVAKASPMADEFPSMEQRAQAVRANCAQMAGQGNQAGLTVLYEQTLLQAADHLRAESSSSAAVFESMAEHCPHAIANAFSNCGINAAAAPESDASKLQKKVTLIVQTEKARMRDAIAKKKAEHQALLKQQEDMAEKRAALEALAAMHSSVLQASRDEVSYAVQTPEEVVVPLHDHADGEKVHAPSEVRASTVLVRPHVSCFDSYTSLFLFCHRVRVLVHLTANSTLQTRFCTRSALHLQDLGLGAPSPCAKNQVCLCRSSARQHVQ
jgi:hypothetical protein